MAVPKFKASKARTRRKHSINGKLKLPQLVRDKDSGELVRPHCIDPTTGMYKGRQITIVEE